MPDCTADATWHGSLTSGDGDVSLGSDAWSGTYATPDAADATNPEELLAAGHASCFAMTTAYLLDQFEYDADDVHAEATVTLERGEEGFTIPSIDLTVTADVPDAAPEEFDAVTEQACSACPVSNALAGTEIAVEARLAD